MHGNLFFGISPLLLFEIQCDGEVLPLGLVNGVDQTSVFWRSRILNVFSFPGRPMIVPVSKLNWFPSYLTVCQYQRFGDDVCYLCSPILE